MSNKSNKSDIIVKLDKRINDTQGIYLVTATVQTFKNGQTQHQTYVGDLIFSKQQPTRPIKRVLDNLKLYNQKTKEINKELKSIEFHFIKKLGYSNVMHKAKGKVNIQTNRNFVFV